MRLLCLAPEGCRNLASEPSRRDGLCDECRARRKARSAARAAVERLDAACRKAAEVGS